MPVPGPSRSPTARLVPTPASTEPAHTHLQPRRSQPLPGLPDKAQITRPPGLSALSSPRTTVKPANLNLHASVGPRPWALGSALHRPRAPATLCTSVPRTSQVVDSCRDDGCAGPSASDTSHPFLQDGSQGSSPRTHKTGLGVLASIGAHHPEDSISSMLPVLVTDLYSEPHGAHWGLSLLKPCGCCPQGWPRTILDRGPAPWGSVDSIQRRVQELG